MALNNNVMIVENDQITLAGGTPRHLFPLWPNHFLAPRTSSIPTNIFLNLPSWRGVIHSQDNLVASLPSESILDYPENHGASKSADKIVNLQDNSRKAGEALPRCEAILSQFSRE